MDLIHSEDTDARYLFVTNLFELSQCSCGVFKKGSRRDYSNEGAAMTPRYERHYEETIRLPAAANEIFAYADDFEQLSSHMNQSSSMMMGGSMETLLDQRRGKAVGSHVRMKGIMMGIDLFLEEVVTERQPPHHKAWETVGRQRLLVIENYRLGFDVIERGQLSELRVFIDYDLPKAFAQRWLGFALGKMYAKWCVQQMVNDARQHFIALSSAPHAAT